VPLAVVITPEEKAKKKVSATTVDSGSTVSKVEKLSQQVLPEQGKAPASPRRRRNVASGPQAGGKVSEKLPEAGADAAAGHRGQRRKTEVASSKTAEASKGGRKQKEGAGKPSGQGGVVSTSWWATSHWGALKLAPFVVGAVLAAAYSRLVVDPSALIASSAKETVLRRTDTPYTWSSALSQAPSEERAQGDTVAMVTKMLEVETARAQAMAKKLRVNLQKEIGEFEQVRRNRRQATAVQAQQLERQEQERLYEQHRVMQAEWERRNYVHNFQNRQQTMTRP